MRRADLRSRRGLVRLNRADLNSSIFKTVRRAGLRLGHDEGRGLVSLDPADHDDLSPCWPGGRDFLDEKNTRTTFLEQT